MSYNNQSRAKKNESMQYRKQQGRSSNSSNNQCSSSSAKGGGGTANFGMGRDLRVDVGFAGFRSGQGGNFGVVKNARTQAPPQFLTGILAGPMQSMVAQGGVPRNSPDADRWQRATNFEEEAKQRQLKAILNKLTPQNFEKLFGQVKDVNIDNPGTLAGVVSQIFDKALMEPTFCEMYANFCHHLAGELPDFVEDNEKITFKRLLLNKCQEEFERGEKEQEEANRADAEGEIKQSPEEREEKRLNARRRMLGNIRLIGELYKKRMLTERIMHECIKKLLGQYQNPDEEDLESLCMLMSIIGEMIDHPKAKDHMDGYYDRMTILSNNMKLSSRIRFMLKDSIDLRRNKWQQQRKVEGPEKIDDPSRVQAPASTSEKELLEEVLRDKFLAAIKEYYSARDEREIALCIKELDSPSFHPSMVSFWVNDSFERKDMERDLLAKLLVSLTRSEESILTQLQLVKGFESVLTSLEDIVNDAPKAAEFLGRIFGKAVSEKVVPLEEIGQLLLAGREEPERLKEIGLAGDVIGSILETVKAEKGESLMNETMASSNLHLEDFRPKDGYRSRILEKFI